MLRDVVEIAASYIQYLMLLFQINPDSFPTFFTSPVDVLQYVNLNLLSVLDEANRYRNPLKVTIPLWIPLDFRLQFLVVSVIGPLLIAVVGMFFLSTKIFFLWFMVLLGGTFVLMVAAAGYSDSSLDRGVFFPGDSIPIGLYVGGAVTGTMVIAGIAVLLWYYMTSKEQEDQEKKQLAEVVDAEMNGLEAAIEMQIAGGGTDGNTAGGDKKNGASDMDEPASRKERLDHIMQLETAHTDIVATITRAAYFVVFFVVGLIFARVVVLDVFQPIQSSNVFYALSGVIMFFAAAILVWCLLGLFHSGREVQFNIGVWVRDNFVSMLLLLVSVVYTPSVTNIIAIFSCQEILCLEGYHQPIPMAAMSNGAIASISAVKGSSVCFPCNFTAFSQQCPSSLQQSLCGYNVTDRRLTADANVPCDDVGMFFYGASALMLASFVVTMPVLYLLLTNRSTKTVDSEFPLDARQVEGYTEEERYDEKVHLSDNVAKFIYDPFTREYKHWRLLVIFQKILIVIISVVARGGGSTPVLRNGAIGLGLSLGVHVSYFVYVVYSSPFQRKSENIMTATTQGMLCIVSIMGLVASLTGETPYPVAVVVAVLVVAGPVIALVIGAVLTFRDDVLREKEREERVRVAQQKAEDENNDEAKMVRRLSGGALSLTATVTETVESPNSGSGKVMSNGNSPLQRKGSSKISVETGGGAGLARKASSRSLPGSGSALRGMLNHSRPKLDKPTATASQLALIPGSRDPFTRFIAMQKPNSMDALGAPTLLAQIRQRRSINGGAVNLLKKKGSFTGNAGSDDHSPVSAAGSRTPNSNTGLTPARNAFGAAAANMRTTSRTNTAAESKRAQENWALAKMRVMEHLSEEHAALEKANVKGRGRLKSFVMSSSSKLKEEKFTKGKQWDNFLAQLLTNDTTAAASVAIDVGSGSPVNASLHSGNNSHHHGNDTTNTVAAGGVHGTATTSIATADTLQIGFDPFAKAKEKKRQKLQLQQATLEDTTGGISSHILSSAGSSPNLRRQNSSSVMSGDPPVDDIEDHFRSIQGGAAGRRQHIQLRLKLQEIYERQLKKLQLTQQAVDFRINKETIIMLNNFFVFLGLLSLIALGCATLGSIAHARYDFFTGVLFNSDSGVDTQFVGYGNWDNFTRHCCCVASSNQEPAWPYYIVDVEEWMCDNGNVKERVRRAYVDGALQSGYRIRSLCGMNFTGNCSVVVVGSPSRVNLTYCATPADSYELMLW